MAKVRKVNSLAEALKLLEEAQELRIVAGGTDFMPQYNHGLVKGENLLCIGDIPELKQIREENGWLIIGAGVTLTEVLREEKLKGYLALKQAARKVATPQIRNQGTVGGNLLQENRCMYYNQSISWQRNLNPCYKLGGNKCFQHKRSPECVALFQSDLAPVLIALGAVVTLARSSVTREIPLKDLYYPAGRKSIRRDELMVAVKIPFPSENQRTYYAREALRGAFDFPLISCAVSVELNEGIMESPYLVLGAASSYPVIVADGAEMLSGRRVDELGSILPELKKVLRKHISPFRDTRVNGVTRRDMGEAVAEEALSKALLN